MTIGEIFLILKKFRNNAVKRQENANDFLIKQNRLRENKDFLVKLEKTVKAAKDFNIQQKSIFLKP